MVWNERLKREIPEGWEVKSIFDKLSVQYGFPFSTELFVEEQTEIPVVRIRDILSNSISAYTTEQTDERYRLQEQDLLIGMDGNFHMNYWSDNNSFLNQRSVRLRAIANSTVSIMQTRYDIEPHIKAKELRAKGSTVGHLSDRDLKGLFILVPSTKEPKKVLDSILNKIIRNRIETNALTKLRDELLPLLMNGQVSINYDLFVLCGDLKQTSASVTTPTPSARPSRRPTQSPADTTRPSKDEKIAFEGRGRQGGCLIRTNGQCCSTLPRPEPRKTHP